MTNECAVMGAWPPGQRENLRVCYPANLLALNINEC